MEAAQAVLSCSHGQRGSCDRFPVTINSHVAICRHHPEGPSFPRFGSPRIFRFGPQSALHWRAHLTRVEGFHVRPLAAGDRSRFVESWRVVQARFVDGPAGAVAEADRLLSDVISTRAIR